MKTSLTHLPENKQYEIRRIVDIIRDIVNPEKNLLLYNQYDIPFLCIKNPHHETFEHFY